MSSSLALPSRTPEPSSHCATSRSLGAWIEGHENSSLNAPWMEHLPALAQSELRRAVVTRREYVGRRLFNQGSRSQYWYCIASGAVQQGVTTRGGRYATTALLGAGEWFGDISLLSDRDEPCDAVVCADATLLMIHRPIAQDLLASHPQLAMAVLRMAWSRDRGKLFAHVERQYLPLPGRIVGTLLDLARRFGVDDAQGHRLIRLQLTQTDLSHYVGCSRQRLNKSLGDLTREGFIRVSGTSITLLSVAALEGRLRFIA